MVRYTCCILVHFEHSIELERLSLIPNKSLAPIRHDLSSDLSQAVVRDLLPPLVTS
jgi:hypothetical protein